MTEILIALGVVWAIGIPFFAWGIADLAKNDERVSEAFRMSAELNPVGLLVLSACVVFWPAVLVVRLVSKR